MNPVTSFLVFALAVGGLAAGYVGHQLYLGIALIVLAALVAASLKMANVWQKFVILRMGKLQSVRGAGLFAIIPVLDSVVAVIDGRIQTTAFNAEQALTKDTVPVNVDAIIFWHVHDAEKAALAITNYRESDRPGGADLAARDDRLLDVGGAAIGPQGSGRAVEGRDRPEDRSLGNLGELRWRSATSPSRRRCRMPCPARPRLSARSRRA